MANPSDTPPKPAIPKACAAPRATAQSNMPSSAYAQMESGQLKRPSFYGGRDAAQAL